MRRGDLAGTARRLLLPAALIFVVAAAFFAAIGGLWLRDLRTPRVVLLGAGRQLSVLVTTGDARLLLATGDDPAAFATALERARHPIARRLDVVLFAGSGRDLLVPAALRADRHVRFAAAIGPLPASPEAAAVLAGGLPTLPTPRRIRLGDDLTVTIETARPVEDAALAWRAVIEREATTIVVLSDSDAATRFDPTGPVSALVVAGRRPLSAWSTIPAATIAFADAAIAGRELRQAAAQSPPQTRWALRVFPGEAVRLTFVAAGLSLPPDAAQPLSPAATPQPAR